MPWWDGPGPGMFWLIGLGQLVFWIALIALVATLIRRPREPLEPTRSAALSILEERYARGEIDRDEYLERRSVLERSPRP